MAEAKKCEWSSYTRYKEEYLEVVIGEFVGQQEKRRVSGGWVVQKKEEVDDAFRQW